MFQRSIFPLALTALFIPALCPAQNPHFYNPLAQESPDQPPAK